MDRLIEDGSGDGEAEKRSAGRGRGRGSWVPMTQNTQEQQILRRPHQGVSLPTTGCTSQNFDQFKSEDIINNIVEKSTLSVDAAEFVPKNQNTITYANQGSWPRHSVQNRIQLARESSSNQLHLQQRQIMQSQYYEHSQEFSQSLQQFQVLSQERSIEIQNTEHHNSATQNYSNPCHDLEQSDRDRNLATTMQRLMSIMHSLTFNPGSFASLVPPLLNNIKVYKESRAQFQEIIRAIVEQCINEGNFRYTGARICTSLDTVVMGNDQILFREILYSLCKEKLQKQSHSWQQSDNHSEDEQAKCHGLMLFLAELVAQMEDKAAFSLGELLVQLISMVLKNPGSNSAKYICQALKLAGQTLERDKKGSRKEMENMMRALTELVTEGRADSSVGRMVDSVHQLRNGNWGCDGSNYASSNSSSTLESSHQQLTKTQHGYNEMILYGPDGKVLSAEESQFLHSASLDSVDHEEEPNIEHEYGEPLEDEEDEIVAVAYEEFLKLLPNKKKDKIHR